MGIKLTPESSWTLGIGSTISSGRKRMDCTAAPPHENILVLDFVLYFKGGSGWQDGVSNTEMRLAEWRASMGIGRLHSLEPALPAALGTRFPPLVPHRAAFNLGTAHTATPLWQLWMLYKTSWKRGLKSTHFPGENYFEQGKREVWLINASWFFNLDSVKTLTCVSRFYVQSWHSLDLTVLQDGLSNPFI